ncbi:hypothetical protein O9993_17455 [Vibrio lentus]|nr:hypothetical protein [Vibrio lentus]
MATFTSGPIPTLRQSSTRSTFSGAFTLDRGCSRFYSLKCCLRTTMRYLDSDIILVATMPVSGGLLTPSLTNVRTPINSSDKLSNTNESTPINPAVAARSIIRTLEAHYLMLRQMRTCTADFTYLRMVRRSHSTTTRGFFTSVCRDQS